MSKDGQYGKTMSILWSLVHHVTICCVSSEKNHYTSICIQEFFGCLFEGVEKCRNSQECRYLSWEMDHWTMDIKPWYRPRRKGIRHLGDFSFYKLVIFVCLMLIYAHHSSPSWPSANLSDIHHHPRTQVLQKLPSSTLTFQKSFFRS